LDIDKGEDLTDQALQEMLRRHSATVFKPDPNMLTGTHHSSNAQYSSTGGRVFNKSEFDSNKPVFNRPGSHIFFLCKFCSMCSLEMNYFHAEEMSHISFICLFVSLFEGFAQPLEGSTTSNKARHVKQGEVQYIFQFNLILRLELLVIL
jgi:hypothetical protein